MQQTDPRWQTLPVGASCFFVDGINYVTLCTLEIWKRLPFLLSKNFSQRAITYLKVECGFS